MTKQTKSADQEFQPGSSYQRDDGMVMVEIEPGMFVREDVALSKGVAAKDRDDR